jgi:hypothetical protein
VSFIAVLVRSTPPPNPNPSAPTTVPTPRRYDDKEKRNFNDLGDDAVLDAMSLVDGLSIVVRAV